MRLVPFCLVCALVEISTMDFDADRIYYSHQNLHQQAPPASGEGAAAASSSSAALDEEDRQVDADALRRHYREFLSESIAGGRRAPPSFSGTPMRGEGGRAGR